MTTGKTIALTIWTFVGKVMSLFFNMQSRLVIAFLPRSKHLWISWLQSPSALLLEPQKNKVCHCFHCFLICLPWSNGTRWHDFIFWMLSFKPGLSLSSFTFIKRIFSSSPLSAIRVVSSAYLRLVILQFISVGRSIGTSASASVLQMNIQSWLPLGLTSLISLLSKGIKSFL